MIINLVQNDNDSLCNLVQNDNKNVDNLKGGMDIKPATRDQLNYKVVKGNDLIRVFVSNLTPTEQKLVAYVISQIKPTDTEFQTYEIEASKFAQLTGTEVSNICRTFSSIIDSLDEKAFWVDTPEKRFKFKWFSEASYLKRTSVVCVSLNSNLKEYLLNLDKNFTSYELYNVMALKSKYSFRLYEILKSYEYKTLFEVAPETLKQLLYMGDNYKSLRDLKSRALDRALLEINSYTDIVAECMYLDGKGVVIQKLNGRKVVLLRFQITRKTPLDSYVAYQKVIKILESEDKAA